MILHWNCSRSDLALFFFRLFPSFRLFFTLVRTLSYTHTHFAITHFRSNKISALLESSPNNTHPFLLVMLRPQITPSTKRAATTTTIHLSNICKDAQTNRNIYDETCHRNNKMKMYVRGSACILETVKWATFHVDCFFFVRSLPFIWIGLDFFPVSLAVRP